MRRGWWAMVMVVAAAGATAAAILLPHRFSIGDSHAAGETAAAWQPKTVKLADLHRRGRFRPLLPMEIPSGFELGKVQLVWMVADETDLRLPARQAMRLTYERGNDSISLLEAAHITNVAPRDNLWQVISQGYFGANLGTHGLVSTGSRSGVDYFIISEGLTPETVAKVEAALEKMQSERGSKVEGDDQLR